MQHFLALVYQTFGLQSTCSGDDRWPGGHALSVSKKKNLQEAPKQAHVDILAE